jgi:hypothetical protein
MAVLKRYEMPEGRRYARVQYEGLVFISWKTFDGQRNYALGKCIDVSSLGVGVELSIRIPVGSFVRVRAYGLNLDGSATVRNVSRQAGRYVLGLELSAPLDSEVLNHLCAPPTDGVEEAALSWSA